MYIAKEPKNADAWNWLGYSYRKSATSQDKNTNNVLFQQSLNAYETALTLNPKHLGSHEYIGELYLQMRKPAKAKEHFLALKKYCKKKSFLGGKCEDE